MAFPLGTGRLTDRVRRALRLTGRIRMELEETHLPVVLVDDFTAPIWNLEAARWMVSQRVGNVAGQFQFVGIQFESTNSADSWCVVEHVEFELSNNLGDHRLNWFNSNIGFGGFATVKFVPMLDTRRTNQIITQRITARTYSNALDPTLGVPPNVEMWRGTSTGVANEWYTIPIGPIVMKPGDSLAVGGTGVNSSINVAMRGKIYDQVNT